MLGMLLYYLIFASPLLIYGIGLNRALVLGDSDKGVALSCLKMLICVVSSATLTYLLNVNLLAKVSLHGIYPFMAVLIFVVISIFIESIFRLTAKSGTSEFSVSILIIILAVNESISLYECVFFSCVAVLSFYLFILVLRSVVRRMDYNKPEVKSANTGFILISIAVIVLALLSWNVTWLNGEAFKW